jgi:hypothetical protein
MFTRVCLGLALLAAVPARSQVGTDAADGGVDTSDHARMLTPPPVSGAAYPNVVGSQTRSNYLRGGLVVTGAYSDNMFEDIGSKPISDTSYSLWPTFALSKVTSRLNLALNYSPGFTLYQHTTGLDQTDQNVTMNSSFRLTPHITVGFQDTFFKTSNVLNQPDTGSAGAVSGSGQPPTVAIIAPIADQLSNTTNAGITYQFSRNSMIGGGGIFTIFDYPNPAQVTDLYNSNSRGGSAFYTHRLSRKQYIGASYQFSQVLAFPPHAQIQIQTQAPVLFYTVYLKPTVSFSLSGGPQHLDISETPLPSYRSWSPSATASLGWQESRTNLAVSYVRIVTGGGGLVGAFDTNSAAGSARWQLTRTWNVGAVASYSIYENITPSYFLSTPGGRSLSGTVSVQHRITEHFNGEIGYTRLHQSYSGIEAISNAPNANREFISVSYQFARPLGR